MKKIILLLITLFATYIVIGQTILGIDVSHHQGNINWSQVANDKDFAYVKSTEGMTYTDPSFTNNMINGKNAGVVMGAYHFARPDNNTGVQDANNYLNIASSYIGNGYLPPALDIEDIQHANGTVTYLTNLFTSSQLTSWIQDWCTTIYNQTGVKPVIYTTISYAGWLQSSLNNYGLWIANWDHSPTNPPSSTGNWNDWVFKQYSSTGSVSGISGNVDLNVFNGSINDFNNLRGSEDIFLTNKAITSSTIVNAGETVDAEVDQNYSGISNSVPNVYLYYYLSTDCNLDGSDILLYENEYSTIDESNPYDTESQTLTIPSGTSSGTYYILFVGDATNVINESNENNNTACVQITVQAPLSIVNFEFKKQITVFPNPTSNIVYIKSKSNLNFNKLIIYDLNGRLIKVKQENNLDKINISELTNGIYILEVISEKNERAVFRIIKK